jgi:hypothetical protein
MLCVFSFTGEILREKSGRLFSAKDNIKSVKVACTRKAPRVLGLLFFLPYNSALKYLSQVQHPTYQDSKIAMTHKSFFWW